MRPVAACNHFGGGGIQTGVERNGRCGMALRTKQDRFEGYEVYDDQGKSVGRVILPKEARLFGPTRGTVFLRRDPPRPSSPPRAA